MHNHTENVLLFYDCHATESNLMAILVLSNDNSDKPATCWVVCMLCHAILSSISCHWECNMVLAKEETMADADSFDMVFGEYCHIISHITF